MSSSTQRIVVYLDMVLLIMTASWIIFGVSRGIGVVGLIYNYIYIFVVAATVILNLRLIYEK